MRNDIELPVPGKQTSSSNRLTTVDLDYHGTWFSERVEAGCTNTAITGTNVSSIVFVPPDGEANSGIYEDEGFSLGVLGLKK